MTTEYTHIVDLAKEVEPPEDGILTRTLFNNDELKAVIFGFGQGEELSEHTASMPAILHFIARMGRTSRPNRISRVPSSLADRSTVPRKKIAIEATRERGIISQGVSK
jgi:hypothetical protein